MSKALIVGRFQPFHKGHLILLRHLAGRYAGICIVIGSANEGKSADNPFTSDERAEMIRRTLQQRGILNFEIHLVPDFHDDRLWTKAVKQACSFNVVYSRNPWTLKCFSSNGVKARRHKFYKAGKYSGRIIRKKIAKGLPWSDLVPHDVYEYVHSIKGEERIKKLFKGL